MRYLCLLLLACGAPVETNCRTTGCPAGKTCNVNTGVCVSGVGGGGGSAGGGTGGSGGGSGGGAGGGSGSVFASVKYSYDNCTAGCPVVCTVAVCQSQVEQMLPAKWDSVRTALPSNCSVTQVTANKYEADCTALCPVHVNNCQGNNYDQHSCDAPPPGGIVDGCGWTP